MRSLFHLERYRQARHEIAFAGSIGDEHNGFYAIPIKGVRFRVLASNGGGFEHVSVSPWFKKRTPSWEEMSAVRDLFFEPHEVCYELHVARADHVSFHDYTLHLWRCTDCREVPLPPAIMVGPTLVMT